MSTSTPPPPPYPSSSPPYSTSSSASSDASHSSPPPYSRPTPPPPGVLDLWQLNADSSPNFTEPDISAEVRMMFFAQSGPTGIQPPGPRASSSLGSGNNWLASLPATMFSPASARSENTEPARSIAPSWGAAQAPSAVAPASPPTRAPPALPTHAPSNSNVSGASERFTSPGRQVRRSVVVTEVRPQE
ncbi:hypothetical protein GGG16DRAFT_65307 [Schizophyllum commune]